MISIGWNYWRARTETVNVKSLKNCTDTDARQTYFDTASCDEPPAATMTGTTDDRGDVCNNCCCCCCCCWVCWACDCWHNINTCGPLPSWIAALGNVASWNPASCCVPDCDVAGAPVGTICMILLPVSDRASGGTMYWTEGAGARGEPVARWAAGIADTNWNELTDGWSMRLARSGVEIAEMPLLLDAEDGFASALFWDVTAVVDNLGTIAGQFNDWEPLCDSNEAWDNSRDTTSPDVAGSCDRNGRKAAVMVEKLGILLSDDTDATLGRFDSGISRSKDEVDALIGWGFCRTGCEYDASTVEGLKSSTAQQKTYRYSTHTWPHHLNESRITG